MKINELDTGFRHQRGQRYFSFFNSENKTRRTAFGQLRTTGWPDAASADRPSPLCFPPKQPNPRIELQLVVRRFHVAAQFVEILVVIADAQVREFMDDDHAQ